MTTKKRRREAAFLKHTAYMAELKKTGLEAQTKDHRAKERRRLNAEDIEAFYGPKEK